MPEVADLTYTGLCLKLVRNETTGNIYVVWNNQEGEMIAYYNLTPDYIKLRESEPHIEDSQFDEVEKVLRGHACAYLGEEKEGCRLFGEMRRLLMRAREMKKALK